MTHRLLRLLFHSVINLAMLGIVAAQTPIKFDSETISGLGARNIGSATMSGRIAAVDAVQEGQRLTIFVGFGERRRLEIVKWRRDVQTGLR